MTRLVFSNSLLPLFKVVGEWKAKAEDLHAELDACHSECRNFSAETFRLKAALDETNEQLDIVRRENKVFWGRSIDSN